LQQSRNSLITRPKSEAKPLVYPSWGVRLTPVVCRRHIVRTRRFEGGCDGDLWCCGRVQAGRADRDSSRGRSGARALTGGYMARCADGGRGGAGLDRGGVGVGPRTSLRGGHSGRDLDRRRGRPDVAEGHRVDPRGRRGSRGRRPHHARHRHGARPDRGHRGPGDVRRAPYTGWDHVLDRGRRLRPARSRARPHDLRGIA
jgi:hypothetical protein